MLWFPVSIFGVGWYTCDKSVFGTLTVLGHILQVSVAFYLVISGGFLLCPSETRLFDLYLPGKPFYFTEPDRNTAVFISGGP